MVDFIFILELINSLYYIIKKNFSRNPLSCQVRPQERACTW